MMKGNEKAEGQIVIDLKEVQAWEIEMIAQSVRANLRCFDEVKKSLGHPSKVTCQVIRWPIKKIKKSKK